MHHITRAITFVSILTLLSFGLFAFAAGIDTVDGGGELGIAGTTGTTIDDLTGYLTNIISVFLVLFGVVAVGFIIYGGVQLLTSQGDEKKMETAKHTIIFAIIGLIIIALAAAAVRFTGEAIFS